MNTLLKIALLLILLSFPVGTKADHVEIGKGLVCDTAEQVTRYLNVVNGDVQAALKQVNEEAKDENACLLAQFAFVRGEKMGGIVRNGDGAWQVTEIYVIGIATPMGLQRVPPVKFYSAVKVEETKA